MTARELEEYKALRATIRERGTARVLVFIAGLASWAALVLAALVMRRTSLAPAIPLLLLAGVFEAVFALHTGVERIGRYLQVFFEGADDPGWETRIMSFGAQASPARQSASDPLFGIYFGLAAAMNLAVAARRGSPLLLIFFLVAHALFGARIVVARRQSARQREIDLARFQQLKP